ARDLWQLEGGGDLPRLLRRFRRRKARRVPEPVHAPLRAGSAPAGSRVLVAHDVRTPVEPARCEPAPPLPDQLPDAAGPETGPRRGADALHPARLPGQGQGIELAARTERAVLRGDATVLAQGRGAEREMEGPAPGKGPASAIRRRRTGHGR